MNNAEFMQALKAFAESKRPEYVSRGKVSSLAAMTGEQRQVAEDLRRQAVALIAAVASSTDPNAWAVLSKGTRFDGHNARVARGEVLAGGSTKELLQYVLSGHREFGNRLHEHLELYEQTFLDGGDIRQAAYASAKRYHEGVWGNNNPDAIFESFEKYCTDRGWEVEPEPVKA